MESTMKRLSLVIGVLLVLCAGCQPASSPSPQAAASWGGVQASGDLLRNGEVLRAIEVAKSTVDETKAEPGSPRDVPRLRVHLQALQKLGFAYAAAGRFDEAIHAAEAAEAVPGFVRLSGTTIRASVATMRCEFDEAAGLYLEVRAKSHGVNDASAEGGLAMVDLLEGRHERAVERFDHALSLTKPAEATDEVWGEVQKALHENRLIAYAMTGRGQKAKAGASDVDVARIRRAAANFASYALAEKKSLFFAQHRLAAAILASHAAGQGGPEVDALQARLREVLGAYRAAGDPCSAVIPDPVAVFPSGARAELGLVQQLPTSGASEPRSAALADRDGDGIADAIDKCPDEAEIYNGVEDTDGCPDEAPGWVVGREIRLKEQIPFAHDSDRVEARADATLSWLARLLVTHPEIGVVSIEGHTDDVGAADYNLDLSKRRAHTVVKELVARGVNAARVRERGFGQTRPKVLGVDDQARALNRRVEILAEGGLGPSAASETRP
jgi:outer membrane protein OmpA-like peptidoglycan-associated protein/tetratricopeptide (TPR) repeat protein